VPRDGTDRPKQRVDCAAPEREQQTKNRPIKAVAATQRCA
jgi:hypothetical protein